MIKYRVIERQTIWDGMDKTEATEMLIALRSTKPNQRFDMEEYNWIAPEGKRLGRDPDLH